MDVVYVPGVVQEKLECMLIIIMTVSSSYCIRSRNV